MSAATRHTLRISDSRTPLGRAAAGWVGSKACTRLHFVQKTASGYLDQAAAAGAVVATVRVGMAQNDIPATVAADSEDGLLYNTYRPIREDTRITLPLITSGSSFAAFVSVANTNDGDLVGLARMTNGDYAFDTTGTDYARVTGVDVTNGLITAQILEAKRL